MIGILWFCFSFFEIRRSVTLVSNSRRAIKHCDFGQFLLCVMMIFRVFFPLCHHPWRNARQKLRLIDTLDVHFRLASSKLNWMLWQLFFYIVFVGGWWTDCVRRRHRSRKTEFHTILILDYGEKFQFGMMGQQCLQPFLMKWTFVFVLFRLFIPSTIQHFYPTECWSITYQSIMQSYLCKFSLHTFYWLLYSIHAIHLMSL